MCVNRARNFSGKQYWLNFFRHYLVLLDGFKGESLLAKAPGRVFTSVHLASAVCSI